MDKRRNKKQNIQMEYDIESIDINESYGKFIGVTLKDSMLPIIESGVNSVKLVKIPSNVVLKKYDIILFQLEGTDHHVILSRIIRKKNNILYCAGDNETDLIKVKRKDVIAICIGIENNNTNEYVDVSSKSFKKYSFFRVFSRPFRKLKKDFSEFIEKMKEKKENKTDNKTDNK